ncbi:5-dehydro-4-deoxy-D-glucuronate isomerase [Actinoplanes subtropicus]|uniref:5-dehydro-4-deoxy-D-glucuronate isomerase n=1 Tax=Actinoplanes subtropicus TaxID=543632 RepID=UPI0004C390F2|nr:5-dehydro-4-deoxy-D-glucuronate isomerase [Actinoplanes subtropicus]
MEIRHATHPSQIGGFATADLRANYLVDDLFPTDRVRLVYSHQDRTVIGGVAPAAPITLPAPDALRSAYFCERRELGVVNVGEPAPVTVDGTAYDLAHGDCLYVGRGAESVVFGPGGCFYLISATAHASCPTVLSPLAAVAGTRLGGVEGANDRTIYKHIHADGVASNQLVLGVTVLEPGSMWNTMPCHTHDRRTEVYLYFDLPAEHRVVHLMGRPDETRNIIVANRQAVISPSWSVHCGFGTANYAFVWAMTGENQAFDDMDHVAIPSLR